MGILSERRIVKLEVCFRSRHKLSQVLERDGEGGAGRLDARVRHELPAVQVEGIRRGDRLVKNLTPLSADKVSTSLHSLAGKESCFQVPFMESTHDTQTLYQCLDGEVVRLSMLVCDGPLHHTNTNLVVQVSVIE